MTLEEKERLQASNTRKTNGVSDKGIQDIHVHA